MSDDFRSLNCSGEIVRCADSSLASWTFAEKEHLVTIDRFLLHGRIQKYDVMEVVRKQHNYSVYTGILQR